MRRVTKCLLHQISPSGSLTLSLLVKNPEFHFAVHAFLFTVRHTLKNCQICAQQRYISFDIHLSVLSRTTILLRCSFNTLDNGRYRLL